MKASPSIAGRAAGWRTNPAPGRARPQQEMRKPWSLTSNDSPRTCRPSWMNGRHAWRVRTTWIVILCPAPQACIGQRETGLIEIVGKRNIASHGRRDQRGQLPILSSATRSAASECCEGNGQAANDASSYRGHPRQSFEYVHVGLSYRPRDADPAASCGLDRDAIVGFKVPQAVRQPNAAPQQMGAVARWRVRPGPAASSGTILRLPCDVSSDRAALVRKWTDERRTCLSILAKLLGVRARGLASAPLSTVGREPRLSRRARTDIREAAAPLAGGPPAVPGPGCACPL